MCEIRDEAKTKADKIIEALDRLSLNLERLIADPGEHTSELDARRLSGGALAGHGIAVDRPV